LLYLPFERIKFPLHGLDVVLVDMIVVDVPYNEPKSSLQ